MRLNKIICPNEDFALTEKYQDFLVRSQPSTLTFRVLSRKDLDWNSRVFASYRGSLFRSANHKYRTYLNLASIILNIN